MENLENHNIVVNVQTVFVEAQSEPEEDRYVFAYTIKITNEGAKPAKLLTRHWIITDSNGKVQEVKGEGVIGQQPYLQPGEFFQYTSGTVIETPVGSMQGSYQMLSDDGSHFDAEILPFSLSVPKMLH
ncbi:MAG: Co2+/Mg2+ efflux protein ApaG [Pseudomonadota bacterium]